MMANCRLLAHGRWSELSDEVASPAPGELIKRQEFPKIRWQVPGLSANRTAT
jgi:hypothetical protein